MIGWLIHEEALGGVSKIAVVFYGVTWNLEVPTYSIFDHSEGF